MPSATVPFVGRVAETSRLRAHVLGGSGHALLLSGEAGAGKTTLVLECLSEANLIAHVAFPSAIFVAPGFGLRSLAEIGGAHADVLATELATPEPPSGGKIATLCSAADRVLRARAPGVLVLDDVQWADDLTLTWLSQVTRLLEDCPLRLVLALRAAEHLPTRIAAALAPLTRARRLDTLALGPLSEHDVRMLAEAMGTPVDADQARRVHARTDGLALAVAEMVAALDEHATHVGDPDPGTRVPDAIQMIVGEQLSGLGPDAGRLVAVTALVPQPPTASLVRQVLDLTEERFDAVLDEAAQSGLLSGDGPAPCFRHELQREAVAASLPVSERRGLHRSIARTLEQGAQARAEQVAAQLVGAGETEQAVAWLERAATDAATAHDHGTALTHLSAAMEMCAQDDAETLTRLAVRAAPEAQYCNRYVEGLDLVAAALDRAATADQRGRLLMSRAALAATTGEFQMRIEALKKATTEFRRSGNDVSRAVALGTIALPVDSLMPISERVRLGEEGLALADAVGDGFAIARCAGNLAAAQLSLGNVIAFELWRRAIRALEESPGPTAANEVMSHRGNWAFGALDHGSYQEAGALIARGVADAGGWVADPRWETSLRTLEVLRLWRLGRWDDASAEAGKLHDPRPFERVLVDALLAAIAFEREERPDLAALDAATDVLLRYQGYSWAALCHALSIRIRGARREPQPVRGLLPLIERVKAAGLHLGWDDLLPATAAVEPAAYQRILALLGDLRPLGPRAQAATLFAQGLIALRDGAADAEGLLTRSAAGYEAIGEPYPMAQALQAAADAARDGPASRGLAMRAAQTFERIGARRSLARLLRRSPHRRALAEFDPGTGRDSFRLTDREQEIADLARKGYTARSIAEELTISARTVEKHLERVKDKLGLSRKSDLVRTYTE